MKQIQRRKTPTVTIGGVMMGSNHPIVIQSMTNTVTQNVADTVAQIKLLADAGSELVRITVNDMDAAVARAKKAGVKMLGKTPSKLGGSNYLTVYRDPDGNFIELIGPMKE